MKKYTTVIFDMDGTLLDTLADITDACNYALTQSGYPARTLEEVRSFVGNGLRRLMERAIPQGAENPDFEVAYESLLRYYLEHCRIKTGPYAGIPELLQALWQKGYRMAIVSNKADPAVKELKDVFFSQYITVAIGESDHVRKKPAPDTVLQALKELDSQVEEAVYVGDSEVDRQTAANTGMDCVSVTWGFRDKALLLSLAPAGIIDKPMELLSFLEKSEG